MKYLLLLKTFDYIKKFNLAKYQLADETRDFHFYVQLIDHFIDRKNKIQ